MRSTGRLRGLKKLPLSRMIKDKVTVFIHTRKEVNFTPPHPSLMLSACHHQLHRSPLVSTLLHHRVGEE